MSYLKKRTKVNKITSVLLTATTTLWLSGASMLVPIVASGQTTIDDLQAQIAALLAQITTLQANLSALQGTPAPSLAACSFTRSLFAGMGSGDDVKCRQA